MTKQKENSLPGFLFKKAIPASAFIFMMLAGNLLFAQEVNRFSVSQAVDYAMQNAVPVKNALLDYKIQKEVNREVTSAALPNLSANTI
ncbi:MAG: hypothetical protein EOO01_11135, partial [Chitinophagaceae bacterium]